MTIAATIPTTETVKTTTTISSEQRAYCDAVQATVDLGVFWTDDPAQIPAMKLWVASFRTAAELGPTEDRIDWLALATSQEAAYVGGRTSDMVYAGTDAFRRLRPRVAEQCRIWM